MKRKWPWGILALTFGVHLLLSVWAFAFGRLNEDEGWYLLAGARVAAGEIPYRDFPFSQGPLMPYIEALWQRGAHRWVGDPLWWGRLFRLLSSWAVLALACVLAGRLGGMRAAAVTAVLLGFNPDQIYFSTLVKTYSPAALFLLLGFFLLSRRRIVGAGICWGVAAGIRVSLLPVPLIALWPWRGARMRFAAALTLPLAILLPFLLLGKARFFFWVVGFHLAYDPGGTGYLAAKGTMFRYLGENYGPFLLALLFLLLPSGGRWAWRKAWGAGKMILRGMGACALFLFLLHALLRRSLAEYQTVVAPLAAIPIGVAFAGLSVARFQRRFLLLLAFAALSVPGQLHTTYGRVPGERGTVFRDVARVGKVLASLPEAEVFTFHPLYPLLAGKRVVPGGEMGVFSYTAEMRAQEAAAYRMTTNAQILDRLSRQRPLVLLAAGDLRESYPSGRSCAPRFRQEILDWLADHYTLYATIPHTGQFDEPITLYRPLPK